MLFPPTKDKLLDKTLQTPELPTNPWLNWFKQVTIGMNFISPVFSGGQANSDLDLSVAPGLITPWPGFLILEFSVALTAGRALTLPVAPVNSLLIVTRSASGAFNLDVNSIKNLAANEWIALISNGTTWRELMFGSL